MSSDNSKISSAVWKDKLFRILSNILQMVLAAFLTYLYMKIDVEKNHNNERTRFEHKVLERVFDDHQDSVHSESSIGQLHLTRQLNYLTKVGIVKNLNKENLDKFSKSEEALEEHYIAAPFTRSIFLQEPAGAFERNRKINETKKDILLYGLSFQYTLEKSSSHIVDALCRGVKIKILLPNTTTEYYEEILKSAERGIEDEKNKYNETFNHINKIHKIAKKRDSCDFEPIEVKAYEKIPHNFAYIFDKDNENKRMYIIPLQSEISSYDAYGFWIPNKSVEKYIKNYDKIWDGADPCLEGQDIQKYCKI